MDCAQKVYQWEKYQETVSDLLAEVNDIFRIRCFYDFYNWEYHEVKYKPDEETPYLKKLSELLQTVKNFTQQHLDELNQKCQKDCEEKSNLEKAFEAWRRGLCIEAVKNVPRYISTDPFNDFETYDEIASFLTSPIINYEATQEAINEWQATRLKKSA